MNPRSSYSMALAAHDMRAIEERASAKYFTDSASPCGNREMQLLMEVKQALVHAYDIAQRAA